MAIGDGADVRLGAVFAQLGGAAAEPRHELIDGICGSDATWNSVRKMGWSGSTSTIGNCPGGRTLAISRSHAVPRPWTPEVVDPQEAALLEVLPQGSASSPLDQDLADVGHHHERALEEERIGHADDEVIGLAVGCPADRVLVSSDSRMEKLMSASG